MNKYTSNQIFLLKLHREKWFVKIQLNEKIKRVKRLFFVNKIILENFLIKNFEILIMNCIYKINRYKMFPLIIVDETILNITFYVAFAFLIDKTKKILIELLINSKNYTSISIYQILTSLLLIEIWRWWLHWKKNIETSRICYVYDM